MHVLLINRLKKRQELFRKKTVPEKLRSWRILKVVNGICKTCLHTPLDFIYEYPKNKKIEKWLRISLIENGGMSNARKF